MPRRHFDPLHTGDGPSAQQAQPQRELLVPVPRHVGNRWVGRLRERSVELELLGKLVSLGGLGVSPDLLQSDHIGVGLAQGPEQGLLPILPMRPESPPDVPGHDPQTCRHVIHRAPFLRDSRSGCPR